MQIIWTNIGVSHVATTYQRPRYRCHVAATKLTNRVCMDKYVLNPANTAGCSNVAATWAQRRWCCAQAATTLLQPNMHGEKYIINNVSVFKSLVLTGDNTIVMLILQKWNNIYTSIHIHLYNSYRNVDITNIYIFFS